jgi:hypothetical protein
MVGACVTREASVEMVIVSAVSVPSGATSAFAVTVVVSFPQLALSKVWLCRIKLVRTFSMYPSGPTRVALEARLKVSSPSVDKGRSEYTMLVLYRLGTITKLACA